MTIENSLFLNKYLFTFKCRHLTIWKFKNYDSDHLVDDTIFHFIDIIQLLFDFLAASPHQRPAPWFQMRSSFNLKILHRNIKFKSSLTFCCLSKLKIVWCWLCSEEGELLLLLSLLEQPAVAVVVALLLERSGVRGLEQFIIMDKCILLEILWR